MESTCKTDALKSSIYQNASAALRRKSNQDRLAGGSAPFDLFFNWLARRLPEATLLYTGAAWEVDTGAGMVIVTTTGADPPGCVFQVGTTSHCGGACGRCVGSTGALHQGGTGSGCGPKDRVPEGVV